MRSRLLIVLTATYSLLLVNAVGFVSTCFADQGEDLFKQKCANCHSSGGEAEVVSPAKYAGVQWERFFKRNRHKRKKDIRGQVTPAEVEEILEFLVKHAADSDKPIAAGIR